MGKMYFLLSLTVSAQLLAMSCKKDNNAPIVVKINPNDSIIETVPPVLTAVESSIDSGVGGYYISKPANYSITSKNYPLLIFIPGIGQYGNGSTDLPLLLDDGIAKLVSDRQFPPNFNVNDQNYSFIVITPQLRSYPPDAVVADIIAFAKKNFRIDSKRVYVSGLSIGGVISTRGAAAYPAQIAAIAPMADENYDYDVCQSIAQHNMPVWDFHNTNDPTVPASQAIEFINRVNSYNPVIPPRFTLFPTDGHDAWTAALSPAYKENNMNVYEWMLHYSR